ncbi:glycoside hydrolase [Hesseltinella vesiculosa]|uniref:glucan endo-1,3-beta-D-glucosidase n=1 Tax=Hesseltinella vesiculosa TaxID=101127 RepID=A0A1X2GTR1_9FUNG|nr:glycoside hydrolase [Hesseltinella vesiculosa]
MHFSSLVISGLTAIVCATGLVQAAPVEVNKRASKGLYGITYTARTSAGQCQTYEEVLATIQRFNKNGVMNIRTYSQECGQLPNIVKAIEATNSQMTVMAAAWIGGSDDQTEINTLLTNVKNVQNKKIIKSIMIGNEAMFSNYVSADTLVGYINQVKKQVQGIPVGTVDTPNTFPSNLIAACDTIGVNIHPYFGGVNVNQAGSNLMSQYNAFKGKASNKDIFITETGWPSAGNSDGSAVPGTSGLQSYVEQLTSSVTIPYYFFESIDSNWKPAGANGVENHWGLVDASGKSKIPSVYQ